MTKIEWCDEVWNPVTGCTRVSTGCDDCYAAKMTKRLDGMGQEKYKGLINPGKKHFNGVVKFHPEDLTKPGKWKKPRVIFVNSMSDVFHEGLKFTEIDQIFAAMAAFSHHQYIVLTKRPEIAIEYFKWRNTTWLDPGMQGDERIRFKAYHQFGVRIQHKHWRWPLSNVWIGVSVEDQASADDRIPLLVKIPAAHRLISLEPMVGKIKLYVANRIEKKGNQYFPAKWSEFVDWVIAGGESGNNARPVHPDWIRSIRDQCAAADVPFFFKQWGEWLPLEFDAQPPFRFFSHDPTTQFDGHGINVQDPETSGPGKFRGYRFMDAMDSITYCMETKSTQVDFLRVGKKKMINRIDRKEHLNNPARELL